jgi:hypothetical protein
MNISIRSHLIAGTAAVVGAGAIAMTPVTAAHLNLPTVPVPSAAAVSLAGFDNPITELINTFNLLPNLLFSDFTLPFFPSPNPLSKTGLFPQIINDALPVVRQLGVNGSSYLLTTLNALTITAQTLSEAVWNFPEAVIDSITSLSLTPIINAILGPINTIGTTLLQAGTYVFEGVLTRAGAVLSGIPAILSALVQTAYGQVVTLFNTGLYVGQSVIGASSIEGVWNATVDGLFGPGSFASPFNPAAIRKPSIPGALVNLTLGFGQSLDPASQPLPSPGSNPFVPSVRQLVSGVVQGLKAELATANPAAPVNTPPPAASVTSDSPVNTPPPAASVTSDSPVSTPPPAASVMSDSGSDVRAAASIAAPSPEPKAVSQDNSVQAGNDASTDSAPKRAAKHRGASRNAG